MKNGSAMGAASAAGMLLGRSFFPIAALVLIVGTLAWGPWVTLVAAFLLWKIVGRVS